MILKIVSSVAFLASVFAHASSGTTGPTAKARVVCKLGKQDLAFDIDLAKKTVVVSPDEVISEGLWRVTASFQNNDAIPVTQFNFMTAPIGADYSMVITGGNGGHTSHTLLISYTIGCTSYPADGSCPRGVISVNATMVDNVAGDWKTNPVSTNQCTMVLN